LNIADLHIHTFFSDGDLSPEEIIEESISRNISYISITDHDNLTGYKKANSIINKSRNSNLKIVPGIELSSSVNNSNIHLLAYFFDPNDKDLNSIIKTLQLRRNDFAKFAIKKLNEEGVNISWGDIVKNSKGSIGRLHIAYALISLGYVKNTNDAFDTYLHKIKSIYKNPFEINAKELIELIRKAGGVCSLAHPHTVNDLEKSINDLYENGLVGIEIVENKKIKDSDEIMSKFDLTKTAGSDFHRHGKKSYLGKNFLNEQELLNFYNISKNKLNGEISWNM